MQKISLSPRYPFATPLLHLRYTFAIPLLFLSFMSLITPKYSPNHNKGNTLGRQGDKEGAKE